MSILNALKTAGIGKVLAVYASASFVVLQAIDLFRDNLELPEWIFGGALVLLIIGLPIIVATAVVQQHDFKSQLIERNFTWRRAIGGGVVAFTILLVAGGFYARDRFGNGEELDANLVAVFPFRVSGANASLHYLKEGMVDLLAAKLTGESGPRAADPRVALSAWRRIEQDDPDTEQLVRAARTIGARRILVGEVVGTDAQLTINASVTDTRTGRRVQHTVTGPADSLQQRVDELTGVLLSLDAGEPRDRLASLTSTSLPALRSYLLGSEAMRHANLKEAGFHFVDAMTADSTFAVAALSVVVASYWTPEIAQPVKHRAERLAWAYRERLPELDRLKLLAFVGPKFPKPSGTAELCTYWQQILDVAPDRAEAWHYQGDCLYHYWRYSGIAEPSAKARAAFEKSLALDSTFKPNVEHLIRIAANARDSAAVRRYAALFLAGDTASENAAQVRFLHAYATGAPRDKLLELAQAVTNELGVFAVDLVDDPVLADTLLAIEARVADPAVASLDYLALGRHVAVAQTLPATDQLQPGLANILGITAALYSDYDPAAGQRHFEELSRVGSTPMPEAFNQRGAWSQAVCLSDQWRLWKGDASGTDLTLTRLRDVQGWKTGADGVELRRLENLIASSEMCASIVEAIRATVQQRSDAMRLALRLDSISATFPQYGSHGRYIRLVASRLFELNGDLARARTAVNRYNVGILPGYHDAQWLQSARLSVKLGDREAAVRDYRKYLGLHAHADGYGAVQTERVRKELEAVIAARN